MADQWEREYAEKGEKWYPIRDYPRAMISLEVEEWRLEGKYVKVYYLDVAGLSDSAFKKAGFEVDTFSSLAAAKKYADKGMRRLKLYPLSAWKGNN